MALNHSPKIIKNGLVLALDAANPKSYPGSGTTWFDLSGNGNNGTLTNGPTFDSANNGSIVFDGANDLVTIPNPLNQSNLQQAWSICSWVEINNVNSTQTLISGLNAGLHLNWFSTGRPLLYLNSGANDYYTYGENTKILGNGWLYISFVFRNSDGFRKIYKNSIDISTSGPNATSTPSGISSTFNIANGNLNGKIGKISIYNYVLSVNQIKQNFNATRGRYGI